MLLARPHAPGRETVNDLDCHLANAWRAIQADPDAVAEACDWPINECDLHSRNLYTVNDGRSVVDRLRDDPQYYDARLAGWWIWGKSAAIGDSWCRAGKPRAGKPVGVPFSRPHLSAGQGVHAARFRPTEANPAPLLETLRAIATRLRYVRVLCGDWRRAVTPHLIEDRLTGIFLDPPYSFSAGNGRSRCYAEDSTTVSAEVRAWAMEHCENPRLRIALCGYEGEHVMPANWEVLAWTANGGMANMRRGEPNNNRELERIWFSPGCLRAV